MRRLLAALFLIPFLLASEPLVAESAPPVKVAVAPKYPALTLAGRIYGDVAVSIEINRSGAVGQSQVISGHPMLREAALVAARQWQFAKSSSPLRRATLTFRFVILPEDSDVKSQTLFLPPAGFEVRERPEPASRMEEQQDEPRITPEPISVTRLVNQTAPSTGQYAA